MNKPPDMNGPESAPLRNYIKSYLIKINIYDGEDNLIKSENLDYGNFEHKKFLGRLSFWAWDLGYTVETMAYKKVE